MTVESLRAFYKTIREHKGSPICRDCYRLLNNYPDDTQSSPVGAVCWACFVKAWNLTPKVEPMSYSKSKARTYSHMSTFDNCMRLYGERYYYKRLGYIETPEMKTGKYAHQQLYLRLASTTSKYALPPELEECEAICQSLTNKGLVHAELPLAIDSAFNAVPYDSEQAWFRGKLDVLTLMEVTAFIGDWKTGNPDFEDPFQNKTYGVMVMAKFPHIERIGAANLWLKNIGKPAKKIMGTVHRYTRAQDFTSIATDMTRKIDTIERAEAAQLFPPMQGPFCKGCEVKNCEFYRPKV